MAWSLAGQGSSEGGDEEPDRAHSSTSAAMSCCWRRALKTAATSRGISRIRSQAAGDDHRRADGGESVPSKKNGRIEWNDEDRQQLKTEITTFDRIKMGIDGFERRFLESLRVGFYLRVLEEGEVGAGDVFELIRPDPERMTVRELNSVGYFDTDNLQEARRALRIQALSVGWRDWLEKRLMAPDKRASSARGLRRLSVGRKVRESDVITSFYLESDDGEPLLPFVPGQFLPLRLDVPGQPTPLTRTYSLSDGPADRDHYRLSIKREGAPENRSDLPPGVASSYLHDQVEPGTKLEAAPPRGKFTLDPWSEMPAVLLSAGVGLTPMISMLNAIVESGSGRPVWFIHGARSGREHAFGEHVRRLAVEHHNVRVHVRYSGPETRDVEGRDFNSVGRVDTALVREMLR